MKKIIFTVLLLSAVASAQEPLTVSRPLDSLPIQAQQFVGRDQFANLYFISDNVITKYNGKRTLDYKNIAKGNITHADIQNPLLILLFYKDFNTIVLLDDQLNEVGKINFNENPDFPIQAHAAGIASQNRIWIYDSLKQQIFLYDYKQNTFRSLTPSFKGNILHFESDFNEFRWIDEGLNIYACDVYGKISTLGKAPEFDDCEIISDDQIIYGRDGKLYVHSLVKNVSSLIRLNEKTFKSFYYKDQILSIFTNQGITNYKITLP